MECQSQGDGRFDNAGERYGGWDADSCVYGGGCCPHDLAFNLDGTDIQRVMVLNRRT